MKLRVGNGCWHAFHIEHAFLCKEVGFFEEEGLDVEIVHAKINPKGMESSRPGGERYDEVGTVLKDMIAYGIDVIPDVWTRTVFAERDLGNDELYIIGGWRNWFGGTAMASPGLQGFADLKGKRIGDWYTGGITTLWWEHQLRKAGLAHEDVQWKVGYKFGSMREAWKTLLSGDTDAAIVQNPWVPDLLEQGFVKLYDFDEETKPYGGRPDRVTVARKEFVHRNPEALKRYWRAAIRGYYFMRIVPENFPFRRYVEAKLRRSNPDESERMRDLVPMQMMDSTFFPMNGQVTEEAIWHILEEHIGAGTLPRSVGPDDIRAVLNQGLVHEAWAEVSQTDEIKRSFERLRPVMERLGH